MASFAEILSLGAVIPFITVLQDPDQARLFVDVNIPSLKALSDQYDISWFITVGFCALVFLGMSIRLFLVFFSARFTFGLGSDLSCKMMSLNLSQSYQVHLNRNSSEVIAAMTTKTNSVIYSAIVPSLLMLNSSMTVVFLTSALIFLDPLVAIVGLSFLGGLYLLISFVAGKKLSRQSRVIANYQNNQIRYIQEGIGAIRDVILSDLKPNILRKYSNIDRKLRRAHGNNQIIGLSPRFLLEGIGIISIAIIALILTSQMSNSMGGNGEVNIIALLGAYALGAQRILPALQNMYVAWANTSGDMDAVYDALGYLEQPEHLVASNGMNRVRFDNCITFKNINFSYFGSADLALKQVSVVINKGDRVGIFGTTGSGKSTFCDLLMGLHQPKDGKILVDGVNIDPSNIRGWQNNISHVPQKIFLVDGTIAENVALGIEPTDIDIHKVNGCLRRAQLSELVASDLEEFVRVGEDGSRLSGGQVQRIGIARALYLDKKVIVFDEATSALDSETEASIMDTIYNLGSDLTLVMIAHRTSTLDLCNRKFKFLSGSLSE
ncbi:ABC transporter ATP-binding protein/permease [Gammaproteobacteria bacterium]|nr:ABC transporter ATP-binding protein/permease [Gammaproteobacteria bacterium]